MVFIPAESADDFAVGVHNYELPAEGIFDFDGLLVLLEGEVFFVEHFGDLCGLESEACGAGIEPDGGGGFVEGFF